MTSWCPPYSWPATPQSFLTSARIISLLGTQVSCPLHLGKSGSENSSARGGLSTLQGWAQAAAAHVPLSSSPSRCLSKKCPSGQRVRLLCKGTQGSLLPNPVAFSADSESLGQGGSILGKSRDGASKGQRPSGWGDGAVFCQYMIWVLFLPSLGFSFLI